MEKGEKPSQSRIRTNTSFACMPDLLEEAKEICWKERESFSSRMEKLLEEWVKKMRKKA